MGVKVSLLNGDNGRTGRLTCGSARTRGEQSRAIGWQPIQGIKEFFESIPRELQNAAASSH